MLPTRKEVYLDFSSYFDILILTAVIYPGCLLRYTNVLKAGQMCELYDPVLRHGVFLFFGSAVRVRRVDLQATCSRR